ncbi:hypothetical protein ADL12_00760 [Streptomyces regalis]|uniref:SnoaL-like domain-containing protein n=1 Tax=Streptomyces regalis TaxID=68262 RepID=A0A0X3VTK2_9ACTN|nr:hypothetical protein ADL12_00760 [Streptomyces regalis]
MPNAEARVVTDRASRYLVQLCRHAGRMGHYEDTFRKVDGTWLLATRTLVLPFGGPTERLDSAGQS